MRRRPTANVISAKKKSKLSRSRRRLKLESLEPRMLLASLTLEQAFGQLSGHGGVCNCPVCTGIGLGTIPVEQSAPSGPEASSPLSSLPQLHSNPNATAKLFLDFDGHFEAFWGGKSNVTTPAFDQDGDVSTFSDGELAAIYEIWARVAEDYAPFNIDVTTVDTGNQTNGVTAVIAIGGNYSDWYGSGAGGVAYVGGFSNFSSNVGYVFENALGSNARYVAEASSHEAGHLFGLRHQALWNGSTLVDSYNPGNANWAPIMGVSYSSARSTWHDGPTNLGSTNFQDDVAVIAGAANGFGLKSDDYGNTIPFASNLAVNGTSVNFAGLIEQNTDVDMWEFTTGGGQVSFTLSVAQFGANLDAIMELRDGSNNVLYSSDPSNSFGASISATVGAGTYYLVARGNGVYGNIGQYTMTGSVPGQSSAPEISVLVAGTAVADGGSVNFGSTPLGTTVSRTFTVRNDGSATLTLTQLTQAGMPAGYTLVSALGSTSIAAGGSTTFTVRLDAGTAGTFAGTIQLASNDGDESPYDLSLTGSVTAAPEITVLIGSTTVSDGGSVNFGSTPLGTTVSRTFTVRNDGNATLTLTSLNANSMPSGYTLTSNLGSTSLAPGASTNFTVRLDAASGGTFAGSIQLLSSDSDESPYDLSLTGTVTTTPEITILLGSTDLADGGQLDFGSTQVGSSVSRTITVKNDGSGTLTLTALDSNSMPSGFTLTSNLGSTSLAPGATTSFTVRLDAASAGSFSGSIQLLSNDGDESPFDLSLSGTVAAPEISMFADGSGIGDGVYISYGTVSAGSPVTKTFTVRNDGGGLLHLTALDSNSMPAGFTLTSNLSSLTLANGETSTFTVRLDANAAGSYSGQIQVLNDDSNENPFRINLMGSVAAPEISMFADGSGIGDGVYIDFGATNVGSTVTKTFTVRNDGSGTLHLSSLDPNSMPAGFTLTSNLSSLSLTNGQTATFTVRFDATSGGSFGGEILVVSDDANENPFHINVLGLVTAAPEITINENGASLSDGGSLSFGTTAVGTAVTKTFTVTNDGNATLSLSALNPNAMPAGFTLVSNLGSTSLAPGASTTFVVRLDATAAGNFSGSISLINNDSNENPFDLTISGAVNSGSQSTGPKLIDNGAGGWSKVGSWTYVTGKGRDNDVHRTSKGSGSFQSNWTFNNLADGDYWVWASWTGNANNATNAPFTVYDGTQAKAVWRVDQRAASSGFDADGTSWRYLGTVSISSGQMVVRLTNAANNFVVADAIRIDKVFDTSAAALPAEFVSPAHATSGVSSFLASVGASNDQSAVPARSSLPSSTDSNQQIVQSFTHDSFFATNDLIALLGQGHDASTTLVEQLAKRHHGKDDVDSVLSDWGVADDAPLPDVL